MHIPVSISLGKMLNWTRLTSYFKKWVACGERRADVCKKRRHCLDDRTAYKCIYVLCKSCMQKRVLSAFTNDLLLLGERKGFVYKSAD